jgi:hypothetical protein
MLSIFSTGGLTLGITLFWLILSGWLGYQSYVGHNSEYGEFDKDGQWVKLADKTPYLKMPQSWGVIGLTVLYIVVLFFIASDYR